MATKTPRTPRTPLRPPDDGFQNREYSIPAARDTAEAVTPASPAEMWGEARREDLWTDGTRSWARLLHQVSRVIREPDELLAFHDHVRRSLLNSLAWEDPETSARKSRKFQLVPPRVHSLWAAPAPSYVPPGWFLAMGTQTRRGEGFAWERLSHQHHVSQFMRWAPEPELSVWATVSIPSHQNTWTPEVLDVLLTTYPVTAEVRLHRLERWIEVWRASRRAHLLPKAWRWHDMMAQSEARLFFRQDSEAAATLKTADVLCGWRDVLGDVPITNAPAEAEMLETIGRQRWCPLSSGVPSHVFGRELAEALRPFARELGAAPPLMLSGATWGCSPYHNQVEPFLSAIDASWQDWAGKQHPADRAKLRDAGAGNARLRR
jgi:hypothetical protein